MTPPVIVEGVWKKFRKGESHDSLRDWIPALLRRAFRHETADLAQEEFWAIRDVSFEVHRGEALAVIGPNGAGKSTTLKMLSRILRPNKGRCEVRGRVGALIEVAAGFHPDLTGTENIYLQGAIMGMRRGEISRHFDEIVEFAGVADFLDTPVKRYSSGMHARLGFSVAAHLEPDVLIIDEVLSVGDMAFQQKCVERAVEFKKRGIAIVFVSHNLQAVSELCDRAVYLAREVKSYGDTQSVLADYLRGLADHQVSSGPIEIVSARLQDANGNVVSTATPGTRLKLRITLTSREAIDHMRLGFLLHRSTDNLRVYDRDLASEDVGLTSLTPGKRVTLEFDFVAHLSRGQYHMQFQMYHPPTHATLVKLNPAALLTITEMNSHGGVADLEMQARVAGSAFGDSAAQHPLIGIAGRSA